MKACGHIIAAGDMRSIFDDIVRAPQTRTRFDLWTAYLNRTKAATVLEIGVWQGEFSAAVLQAVPSIKRYHMLDPWRHLDDWNKPLNVGQDVFEQAYAQAMKATEFAAARRVVLRPGAQLRHRHPEESQTQ